MLVGTDLALSMCNALFSPLAMIVLLSTLGQEHTAHPYLRQKLTAHPYLTDNVSYRHISLLHTDTQQLRNCMGQISRGGAEQTASALQPQQASDSTTLVLAARTDV